VAPSVVTKRITRLEDCLHTRLIIRSTRGLTLTPTGERFLPRFLRVVAELDELLVTNTETEDGIEGHLRILSPTTVTSLYLGGLYSDFQCENPRVTLEVVLLDRSVNPLEENFDLVMGASAASYPGVIDVPLCTYPQVVCCAPGYMQDRPKLGHPGELVDYDCLTTVLFGTTWAFETPRGALSVEVRSRFHVNDGRVALEAARRGLGIAALPRYLIEDDLRQGSLIRLLEEFPLATYWLKALVPRMKMDKPVVRELVAFLKARTQPRAPWDA